MPNENKEATEPIAAKAAKAAVSKKSSRPKRSDAYKAERLELLTKVFGAEKAKKAFAIEEKHEFRTHWMYPYPGLLEEMGKE